MISMVLRGGKCILLMVLTLSATSCSPAFLSNLTEDRTGDFQVQFINNTRYRASFSFGAFDSLDRNPPGAVEFLQSRIEAFTTQAPGTLTCRRNLAIATEELIERVLLTQADETDTFDPDAFDTTVHFSSAPADSDEAALATVGFADGREVRLGVDYSCGDRLIFTFQEDPNAIGGFRIDFAVILDETPGSP